MTAKNAPDNPQGQGWQASLSLGFEKRLHRTVLVSRHRHGPLAVQRALYPEDNVCHVYLLHPPGGVVGGDALSVTVDLKAGAHALLTTPGAAKFYRSAGQTALLHQVLNLEDAAMLEWLPQENIYFPGARVKAGLRINLQGNARIAAWDIQCLGRPVINEQFTEGSVDNHWQLFRDGEPLLLERLRVDARRRQLLPVLNHQAVNGSFIVSGVDASLYRQLQSMGFAQAEASLGLTLVEDLLVVRYLGGSTEQARHLFLQIWQNIRQAVFGREAMVPRIWNT